MVHTHVSYYETRKRQPLKIGILTYHRSHNYGAVLQAYALKSYLRRLGFDVEIIDYWPDYRKEMYRPINIAQLKRRTSLSRRIVGLLMSLVSLPEALLRGKRFDRFIHQNLGVSGESRVRKPEQIEDAYEIYVYGSDQIWRYNKFLEFEGFDPVYWGDYPPAPDAKKITYAASMGRIELTQSQKQYVCSKLRNFDSVSVRESELKRVIQPLTRKEVGLVLDPVFLLSSTDWTPIVTKRPVRKNSGIYLLFYNLTYSKEASQLSRKLSRELGCRIVEIVGSVAPFRNPVRAQQTVSPSTFVDLFVNARFVVTTSFHGVAFALIFNKQFLALGMHGNRGRARDLLESLQLTDRLLTSADYTVANKQIDYEAVNRRLNELRNESIQTLKRMLHV